MKPKLNYSTRPKKTGARKRQRILSQKKRLIAAGHEMDTLNKLTIVEIRDLVKKAARRKLGVSESKTRKTKAKAKRTAVKARKKSPKSE